MLNEPSTIYCLTLSWVFDIVINPHVTDSQATAEEATGSTLTVGDTNNEPFMTKRGNQAALDEKVPSEPLSASPHH